MTWRLRAHERSLNSTVNDYCSVGRCRPVTIRFSHLPCHVEAWSQPGAAAGMINYYRASVRQSQKEAVAKLRPISAPTLVIWGEGDSYVGSELAEPHHDDVPNLDRVERLPDASHWVHHDQGERVNQLVVDFFAGAA